MCGLQHVKFTFYAWKVENGHSILASSHKWMNGTTSIFKDDVSLVEAARLKVADLIIEGRHSWDLRQLYKYFISSSARMIRALELPSN